MVECYSFNMWNMSLSQFFGKTPKINYICGKCRHYNEGRMSVRQVEIGDPYLICNCCGTVNYIPIHYKQGDSDYEEF